MQIQNVNYTYNLNTNFHFNKQKKFQTQASLKAGQIYTFEQAQALKPLVFTGKKYKSFIKSYVDEGLLDEEILHTPDFKSRLNEPAKNDLFCLVKAAETSKNADDVFVPEFKDKKRAIKKINTGDVCKIKNNPNIFIKDDENNLIELGLSKEKYMKLFPPVARFSAIQNDSLGDCWLLATCDSLYSNPNTRARFLSVFKENENGGIDVNFGGFKVKNGKIVPIDKNQKTYENVDDFTAKRALSPKGFACIEEAVEQMREDLGYQRIKRTFDYFQTIKDMEGAVEFEGTLYEKGEIDRFIDMAEPSIEIPFMMKRILIDLSKKDSDIRLNKENIKKYLEYFNSGTARSKFNFYEISTVKNILNKTLKIIEEKEVDEVLLKDIMPTSLFFDFLFMHRNLDIPEGYISSFSASPYIIGGEPSEIYKLFDMKAEKIPAKDAKEKFKNLDNNVVIVADTDEKEKDYKGLGYKIYSLHAYLITPVHCNGKQKYSVRNPHNSSQEIIMSEDELLQRFSNFTFAKKAKPE